MNLINDLVLTTYAKKSLREEENTVSRKYWELEETYDEINLNNVPIERKKKKRNS